MERATRGFWDQLALRWRFSEPLTPGRADISWYERRTAQCMPAPARVLLLGVTPGIAAMQWPRDTALTAVDWSANMLKSVWPAARAPRGSSLACADWRELPVASACIDHVVGDGCYTALTKVSEVALVNAEIHRVLKPGGSVLMRCFCRPAARLQADALFERLFAGAIANLDLFRFLLAMALYESADAQVTRRAVWELWARHVPDARALQARMGWADDDVANMERNATVTHTYCFPTLDELRALWAPRFDLIAAEAPEYPWGALFPRVVLRAR